MNRVINRVFSINFYYFIAIFLLPQYILYSQDSTNTDPDPLRFEKQIEIFVEWDKKNSFPEKAVLFAGSSSIRLWPTHEDFPDIPIINRGFGGAHISDMLYYFDQTIRKYHPAIIVFYCGDNDIAGEKTAGSVYNDFLKFISKMHDYLPGTKLIYLPIKPSFSRWEMWSEMQKTNQLIKDFIQKNDDLIYVDTANPLISAESKPSQFLFMSDSLHLNQKGYRIWQSILNPSLMKLYDQISK